MKKKIKEAPPPVVVKMKAAQLRGRQTEKQPNIQRKG